MKLDNFIVNIELLMNTWFDLFSYNPPSKSFFHLRKEIIQFLSNFQVEVR